MRAASVQRQRDPHGQPRPVERRQEHIIAQVQRHHRDEQIVGILKEHAAGEATGSLCRRHGISQQTLYRWKAKYDGLEGHDVRRLKALEEENARLKREEN